MKVPARLLQAKEGMSPPHPPWTVDLMAPGPSELTRGQGGSGVKSMFSELPTAGVAGQGRRGAGVQPGHLPLSPPPLTLTQYLILF